MSKSATVILLILFATAFPIVCAAQQAAVTEYPLPMAGGPSGITLGPDGAVWFIESGPEGGLIGRITSAGLISEYPESYYPQFGSRITTGPDGALWFTESGNKIGRMTTDGVITNEFPTSGSVDAFVWGPDGALWFLEYDQGVSFKVGRMTVTGVVTNEYPMSAPPGANITVGPDGALWFTETNGPIGTITTSGLLTEYSVPSGYEITAGSDGALWYTDNDPNGAGGSVYRITTGGVVTNQYTVAPSGLSQPAHIALGPDGAIWFTASLAVNGSTGLLGRITTSGTIAAYLAPSNTSQPWEFTTGPDGALWFADISASAIGHIAMNPAPPTTTLSVTTVGMPNPVEPNANLTYTVTVGNSGPSNATNVTAINLLTPSQYTLISSTPSQGTCTAGGTVTCALGTLAPGSSATVAIVVTQINGSVAYNSALAMANETGQAPYTPSATAGAQVLETPPAITSPNNAAFAVGAASSFTVSATGNPAPRLSESGPLPAGVMFNSGSTGVLSGTPAAGTAGTYRITFTASNGVGADAVQNFLLTVDQLPVAQVALNPTSVPGGATNSTGTVTLSAPAAGMAAHRTVTLASSNTAAATVPASVVVAPGATTATFRVTTYQVAATAKANISATLNGGAQTAATLTVTPLPQVASLTVSPASVAGGAANSVGRVTLNAPAAGTAALRTVTLSSDNASAASAPASVAVALGATSATFKVTTYEVAATATANISATLNGGAQSAALTVAPLAGVASLTLSPASVLGKSANATATLTLNAPAAGTAAERTVTLASSNTAAASVPANVVVAAGATTATFTVTSKVVSAVATPVITATLNGSAAATLTVNPLLITALLLNPTSVVGGAANSTATITMNGPAAGTAAERTVGLASSNTAAATVPATVIVAPGATSATFKVTSHPVGATTAPIISASINGETQNATLTVTQ